MGTVHSVDRRQQILELLQMEGKLSVAQLAKRLCITEMAVRRHLEILQESGVIQDEVVRHRVGRPLHLYSLTPSADTAFPQGYRALALELLENAEAIGGPALVEALFQRRTEELSGRFQDVCKKEPPDQRLAALERIQNERGYFARLIETEPNVWELEQHHCPIQEVAVHFPQACRSEHALFANITGLAVETKQTLCEQDKPRCCVFTFREKKAVPREAKPAR
ncbi:MAG: DeoR family transcriptional regulator [Firmicutes bacterium]|nr:DeoR family transcriptional regulator [Bacillota bacterium]